MSVQCKGAWGLLLGHKYLPIFDEETSSPNQDIVSSLMAHSGKINVTSEVALAMFKPATKATYRVSVCQRCGASTQAQPEENKE